MFVWSKKIVKTFLVFASNSVFTRKMLKQAQEKAKVLIIALVLASLLSFDHCPCACFTSYSCIKAVFTGNKSSCACFLRRMKTMHALRSNKALNEQKHKSYFKNPWDTKKNDLKI